jgi:hypothetical protein
MQKNKLAILILVLLTFNPIIAQELNILSGKQISAFQYEDSQGQSLKNIQALPNTFTSMSYRTSIYKDWIHATLGFNFTSYGTVGSDDIVHNYMKWETSYFGTSLGADVKLFCLKKMQFYFNTNFSFEYLIQGSQTLNNQVFDLKQSADYDETALFVRLGLFANYPISKNTKVVIEYTRGMSLDILSQTNEQLYINTHQFAFGLQINLKFKNEKDEK